MLYTIVHFLCFRWYNQVLLRFSMANTSSKVLPLRVLMLFTLQPWVNHLWAGVDRLLAR